jgi:hypothetical protein
MVPRGAGYDPGCIHFPRRAGRPWDWRCAATLFPVDSRSLATPGRHAQCAGADRAASVVARSREEPVQLASVVVPYDARELLLSAMSFQKHALFRADEHRPT